MNVRLIVWACSCKSSGTAQQMGSQVSPEDDLLRQVRDHLKNPANSDHRVWYGDVDGSMTAAHSVNIIKEEWPS